MRQRMPVVLAVVYVAFILLHVSLSGDRIGYDTARNEKIVTELASYGTFTYFDVPFIVSPPLYFIIHSFPVSVFGDGQAVFRATEATLYFLGALLAIAIVRELGFSRRKALHMGLFVFALLLADSQMFGGVQSIDFWGAVLLFSSLLLLSYARLYRKATLSNAIFFGIACGLSMLVKSSFVFLIIPLLLHYLAFQVVARSWRNILTLAVSLVLAAALYAPWVLYLTSNGFPVITNPEFKGELPWDPGFKGYSYIDIYGNLWLNYWPLLYPFSIVVAVLIMVERYRRITFEHGMKARRKAAYLYYLYRHSPGAMFLCLLVVVLLLPFFNKLLVSIPVGEQFLSVGLASSLLLGTALFTTRHRLLRLAIGAVVIFSIIWGAAATSPILAVYDHQNTCPLYTDVFTSLSHNASLLIDERLSRIAYPAHNVLYDASFEWFSYSEQYDLLRLITLNVDGIALIESERIPAYLQSPVFQRVADYSCASTRDNASYEVVVFRLDDRDALAAAVGLPERAELDITGGGKPVQALVSLSKDDFRLEYKSKRDGSLTVYAPGAGTYHVEIARPGFRTRSMSLQVPASGKTLINLETDSPLVTHTTANRY